MDGQGNLEILAAVSSRKTKEREITSSVTADSHTIITIMCLNFRTFFILIFHLGQMEN